MLAVVATIAVGHYPCAVAVSPNGAHLYVANQNDHTVSVIDTTTTPNTVTDTIPVGDFPDTLAVSPNGTHLYVTNRFDNTLSVIDINPSSPTYNTVTDTIPVGPAPLGVAVSPDGTRLYVTNAGVTTGDAGTVSVIDINPSSPTCNTVTETVPVGSLPSNAYPLDVAVSSDSASVYVTNAGDNTVSVIANVPSWRWPDYLVGELLGGVAAGGGGWLVIGNHFYKIPPNPLAVAIIARAAAPHLRSPIENRELSQQLRKMLS